MFPTQTADAQLFTSGEKKDDKNCIHSSCDNSQLKESQVFFGNLHIKNNKNVSLYYLSVQMRD